MNTTATPKRLAFFERYLTIWVFMRHVFASWLDAGWLTRTALLKSHGKDWFELQFLPSSIP